MPGRRWMDSMCAMCTMPRMRLLRVHVGARAPVFLDVKLERYYPHEQGISDAMRLPNHVAWLKANSDPITCFAPRSRAQAKSRRAS